jgi:hypothetical protein
VDIFVASQTVLGRALERDQLDGSGRFRLVTRETVNSPMGTQQSETRIAVIKPESRDPGIHRMARFTLLLLRGELVGIAVTGDTRTLLENILVRRARAALLMAVRTCHSHMGPA